jgi:hypothetical protein
VRPHRRRQHLARQAHEIRIDRAREHDGEFRQAGNLVEQRRIGGHVPNAAGFSMALFKKLQFGEEAMVAHANSFRDYFIGKNPLAPMEAGILSRTKWKDINLDG